MITYWKIILKVERKQKKKNTHSLNRKGSWEKKHNTSLFCSMLVTVIMQHSSFLESLSFETSLCTILWGKQRAQISTHRHVHLYPTPRDCSGYIWGNLPEGTRRTRILFPGQEGRMWTFYLQKRHCVLLVPWARLISVTKQKSENKNCRKTTCETSAAGIHGKTDKTHMEKHAHLPVFTNQWFFWGGETLVTLAHSSSQQLRRKKCEHKSKQTSIEERELAHRILDIKPTALIFRIVPVLLAHNKKFGPRRY